ncbi:MAG: aminoacyl-tRNA hydrolase [Rhodothermales bacterium]|nr:aminoacyl-tRNA hydrolase [Rhodothermales bacterium]
MATSGRLVAGLGNPGPKYDGTRHNVGFEVVDAVAEKVGARWKEKGEAHLADVRWRSRSMLLMKPQTFMNRSGTAIENVARKKKFDPREILVVVDDISLPVGTVRLRPSGGSGGHNGLEDVIDWLDSTDFPRLRIGIGSDFERGGQSDYVLSPFDDDERPLVDEALVRARDAVLTFVTDGLQTATNRFNG